MIIKCVVPTAIYCAAFNEVYYVADFEAVMFHVEVF
jgi:hypothetical protein